MNEQDSRDALDFAMGEEEHQKRMDRIWNEFQNDSLKMVDEYITQPLKDLGELLTKTR